MSRLEARFTLLDRVLGRPTPGPLDTALADRLERSLQRVEPDTLFQRRLRGAVLNHFVAAREGLVAAPASRREMGILGRGVLYASLVLALSVGAAGTAAAGSLPGDLLYPVKLELEELRVRIAPPGLRADLLAMALDERLDEIEQLAAAGLWSQVPAAAEEVALAEARLAAAGAGPGAAAADAIADHIEVLQAIWTRAPAAAQEGLERAIQASSQHGPQAPSEPSATSGDEPRGPSQRPAPEPSGAGQGQQPVKAPKPES